MWGFFLLPVLLSFVLAVGMFLLRVQFHDYLEGLLSNLLNYDQWWEWAQSMTSWLIHISLFLMTWYLYYKLQKYVILIVLSPVLAYISERTERAITGGDYPFNWAQFAKDIVRGILIATRNLFLELGITLLLFLLGLIPVITPFSGLLIFVVGWYYYGYSMLDYTNERRKLDVGQSNSAIKKRKGLAIANGMVFELIFFIPIVGFVVAPILSTVAATIAMQDDQPKLGQKPLSTL